MVARTLAFTVYAPAFTHCRLLRLVGCVALYRGLVVGCAFWLHILVTLGSYTRFCLCPLHFPVVPRSLVTLPVRTHIPATRTTYVADCLPCSSHTFTGCLPFLLPRLVTAVTHTAPPGYRLPLHRWLRFILPVCHFYTCVATLYGLRSWFGSVTFWLRYHVYHTRFCGYIRTFTRLHYLYIYVCYGLPRAVTRGSYGFVTVVTG